MCRSCARRHSHAFSSVLIWFVFVSLLGTGLAIAQVTPEKTSATTVISNVDEVSLDLVVKNKKNKPVLDLKPEDVAVTDGGTAVKISHLQLVSSQLGAKRPITLLFDQLDSAGSSNARSEASRILKDIPLDGFSVSVLKVEGRLGLYQEFTRDRNLLNHAIALATQTNREKTPAGVEAAEKRLLTTIRTGADETGARLTPAERTLDQVTLTALEQSQRIVQEQHSSSALAALLALARSQQRLPGRKVVIYFSQGLRLSLGAGEVLSSIIGTANRSGVSIYAIDANPISEQAAQGMITMMVMGNAMHAGAANQVSAPQAVTSPANAPTHAVGDLTTPGMMSMVNNQFDRFEISGADQTKGPLAQLATNTSGVYIAAGENPRKAMRQMIKDLNSYYEASYAAPIQDYDGQFRPVTVKPVRSGLKIRAKSGYYALPADEETGIHGFELPLLKVLDQPSLPQDLKFQSGILQLGEFTTGYANALLIEVPVSELTTHDDPNSNLYSLHVSMVAEIKNKAGQVVEHFSEDVPRHGALDTKQEAGRSDAVLMQRHFLADPGEYTLEAAVLDENSGKAGAIRSTFTVSAEGSGPFLSDLALVRRMDPFPEETDDLEPLRFGDSRVVPNVSGHVARGLKNLMLFSVLHEDSQAGDPPRMELTILRNHEPIAQAPMQLRKPNGGDALPYMASIQTAALPPGNYDVMETLTQGTKMVERSVAFRIDGPELASAAISDRLGAPASGKDDVELAAVSSVPSPGETRGLAITSLPPGSVPPPAPDEIQTLVSLARKHALSYSKSLPNFVCLEVTNRSVDSSSNGNWKRRDSFAEMLRYVDSQETRTMVEYNGQRTSAERADLDTTWPLSVGEFGGLLNLVFQNSSKTEFQWKETDSLGPSMVDVLAYRVARENANISLKDENKTIAAGFHGLVYIDKATGAVRQVTLEADDLKRDFSIHAATMTVEYDYVTVGTHDYLMPMRATVSLQRGRRQTDLNEMTFRNYRRYASQAKINFGP